MRAHRRKSSDGSKPFSIEPLYDGAESNLAPLLSFEAGKDRREPINSTGRRRMKSGERFKSLCFGRCHGNIEH